MKLYLTEREAPRQIGVVAYWGWLMVSVAVFCGRWEGGLRWSRLSADEDRSLTNRITKPKRRAK